MTTGSASYAKDNGTWILRLSGDVRHLIAPSLNALIGRAFEDTELAHFVIDLSTTEAIDSTTLGILARIANHFSEHGLGRPVIISPNADVTAMLRVACFDRLFYIVTETTAIELEHLEPVAELPVDEREMLTLVLEAHRRLCTIDEQTRAVFQDVVNALESEQRGQ
jgi:anti-anti-sigma factor